MSERAQETDDDGEEAEAPDREFPISSMARFTIGGKPVVLDDFVDITTGDIANRPVVEPQPQPAPMPKEVIWNARRPVED
ncbi:MAG: hypothetical protein OXH13_00240 [Chloroflexi bacterium]|nr:hypothetical protein [Chloroflexota bacterium]MCY3695560.1 hypothetical protein [Chloroflexota bacterium]MXX30814.1 hypothetical protein [Chloroflexota bacterium]MYD16668.1 hypothetical protein [Chloroflexota bacterium]MYJ01254.1 hypothetical protein [Chloroflexota bacterium]